MRVTIILSVILIIPAIGFSDTIIVPDDYTTIQGAIDAAVKGDTVLVKPGTYVENIDFKGKAITVTSELGADVTVIDGNQAGSVVTCKSSEGPDSILDGFTIQDGFSNSGGGGMYNGYKSSPTVTNCIFSGNEAYLEGGGMYNYESSATVTNCTFSGNSAGWSGGGMYNDESSATVTNCTFSGNSGFWAGGGMHNDESSSATVTNCTFSGNTAVAGGGMYNSTYSSSPTVSNCTFSGNSADWPDGGGSPTQFGGGMYNYDSSPTVTNCIFSGNLACDGGGGMANKYYSSPTVTNCTFSGNSSYYSGGGMYNYDSSPTVTNCVLWANTLDQIEGSSTVTYTCIQGGYPGTGNIDADPLFVDEANGDYHLTFNSPCKDTGDNTAVTELYDFEGDPRIAYGTVDMGADEFYTHLYWTGDAIPGGSVELKFVGLPGTNPVFLWVGSGVLGAPIPTKYGDWHLDFPVLFTLGLGSIVSPEGVSVLPYTFDPGFPAMDIPMQSLIGMELTNLCILEVE